MSIDTVTERTEVADQGTAQETPTFDVAKVEAFALKVASDQAAGSNAVQVYLGDRLGIWSALASVPATTSAELADRTGLSERYLREWLSAQTAAGYLTYEPKTQSFTLPAEHAAVLADDSSPAAMIGAFETTAGVWAGVERLAHAFATGEGIGWHEQDPRVFTGVERFFRPLYSSSLLQQWLPAIDGLVERLQSGVRMIDVGCGLGTPTLMMAKAFPASTFIGVDYHRESIERATYAAERAGVQNLSFEVGTAADFAGSYDVICYFDALHDMGDPAGALRRARAALTPGGVVFAVEPGAGNHLEDNLHTLGLAWYAASTALCLPGSLSQEGHLGLGAQAGASRTLEVFAQAGFDNARVVAHTPFNLVYEARA